MSEEGIIKVIVRFRPLLGTELSYIPLSCVDITNNLVTIYPPSNISLTFSFDSVLESAATQEQTYLAGPDAIVDSVMCGFNGTIFAYGQSFSGKTYTIFGDQSEEEKLGIVPRMITSIFDYIDSVDESIEFLIKVSFCEIYMEKIYDLLNPIGNDLKLKNVKKGVRIEGLREVYTTCDFDINELIKVGIMNKNNRDNSDNGRSSSTHTILSICIQQTTIEGSCKVGKLYLVDLAGSEKVSTISSPINRQDQMKSINTSLTTLGIVIAALTEKSNVFIPYRASKLTRILQESLGGNSKTALIITCSPSALHVEETLSSLRFATRVKSVKNFPIINREYNINELVLQFGKKLESLELMNKKLFVLQAQAEKVKTERISLRAFIVENEAKEAVDYTEIKQEIEDIRLRVEKQEEKKKKLEIEIESCDFSISELNNNINEQLKLLNELEKHSSMLEEEFKEVENCCEMSIAAVDTISSDYESQCLAIKSIEIELAKAQSDAEHSKCQLKCLIDMRSSLSKQAIENELRKRIKEEKETNKIMKESMKKIQYEIDLLLFKKYKDYVEAEDLQATGKRIFDLELTIDKQRMKYLEDEKSLTPLQKIAKTQREALGKTADQVDKDYRLLIVRHSEIQIEKLIFQKKSARLEEKTEKLMSDIMRIEKKLASIEKLNGNASQIGDLGKILQRTAMHSSLSARRIQSSIAGDQK